MAYLRQVNNHLVKCAKEGPDCGCVTECKFKAVIPSVQGHGELLARYESAVWLAGNEWSTEDDKAKLVELRAQILHLMGRRV